MRLQNSSATVKAAIDVSGCPAATSPFELTFGLRLSAFAGTVFDGLHEHNGGANALAVA
jgi:hypothetical protein